MESSVVLMAVVAVSLSTEAVKRNAHDGAQRAAGASVVTVQHHLQAVLAAMEDLAQSTDVVRTVQGRLATQADMDSVNLRLSSLVHGSNGFRRAFVTDSQGQVVAYQPEGGTGLGASLAGEEWFTHFQGSTSISAGGIGASSGAALGGVSDGRVIPVVAPMRAVGAGNPIIGFVVGAYDLTQIESFVDGVAITEGLYLTVIDSNGVIVARPTDRAGWVSTRIDAGLVRRAAEDDQINLIDSQGSRGPIFSVYSPLHASNWVLVSDMPAEQAYAEVERLKSTVVTIGILVGGGLLVAMVVGMGQLGRLQKAALDSQRVAAMSRLNVAARLVHSETGPAVFGRITETARSLASSDFAVLVVDRAELLGVVTTVTASPADRDLERRFRTVPKPLSRRLATEHVVSVASGDELFPNRARSGSLPAGPMLVVPLRAGDAILGMLVVGRGPEDRAFELIEEGLMEELANHAVTAVQKARHEQELQEFSNEVLQASHLKSRFLATMSHELRTPLNSVLGFTQMLHLVRTGELNELQRRYVDHIETSGRQLLNLIDEILDLSKIEAGHVELEIAPMSLEPTILEVTEGLHPLASSKGLFLRTELPAGQVWILGDARRVQQVLTNLVANAIKFTQRGGVTIRCAEAGEVSVIDTGIGISDEAQLKIFEEFTQADSTTTRQFGGTGLGLSISRKLIELQGGRMGVESAEGKGSRFWFTLPTDQLVSIRTTEQLTGTPPETGIGAQH